MKKGAIYWGVFLLSLGLLLLVNSIGWFAFADLSIIIKLWPLFIIFWGISYIKKPDQVQKIMSGLAGLFLGLFLFAIFHSGLHFSKNVIFHWGKNHKYNYKESNSNIPYDSTIKSVTLNLDLGAGEFQVSDTTNFLFESNGKLNNSELDFTKDSSSNAEISFSSSPEIHFFNKVNNGGKALFKLNKNVNWSINLNVGAAETGLDLKYIKLKSLTIDAGACDLKVKVGELAEEINTIEINSGASDITVEVPDNIACKIETSTGLSGEDFVGFTKSNDSYLTENYNQSSKKLNIQISGGVSSFTVKRVKV